MFNLTKFANGTLPEFLYDHGAWFLMLSNDVEMERIKKQSNDRLTKAKGRNALNYKIPR